MPRRKQKDPEVEAAPAQVIDQPSGAFAPTGEPESSKNVRGLYIRRNPEGKFDLSILRTSTREQIKELAETPGFFEAAGVVRPDAPAIFNRQWCETLYKMLSYVEALTASALFRLPMAECLAVCQNTVDENDLICPPTQAVLNKRAPEWLKRLSDESNLFGSLAIIETRKYKALVALKTSAMLTEHGPNGKPVEVSDGEARS